MTERFQRAVDALYKGFFEGTLMKGTCVACAVGNIVAAGQGSIIKIKGTPTPQCTQDNEYWYQIFCSNASNGTQSKSFGLYPILEERLFNQTGYTAEELAKVENAFERNSKIHWQKYYKYSEQEILEDQYNGLVAVFDVLMELDDVSGPEYKEKLKTHPKLVLV